MSCTVGLGARFDDAGSWDTADGVHAGATEGGKQRTPDWLGKIFGMEPQVEAPRLNLFGDE